MDRLVVSSISGHVNVGEWEGEHMVSQGTGLDYLKPLNAMVDWRRKLSLFSHGKGSQLISPDGRQFTSIVHYMESQRHRFVAELENAGAGTEVSFDLDGAFSSLSDKPPKTLVLQSVRVLSADRCRKEWQQHQRDAELEKALHYMFEHNHESRAMLIQTGMAELWVGREFLGSDEDWMLDFFLAPCSKVELANGQTSLRRFHVLEKVRTEFRFAYWMTPEFLLGLQPKSADEPSVKRIRLEEEVEERRIEAFVRNHSMYENLHNLSACFLQHERMDVVKSMAKSLAKFFLVGKTSGELRQILGMPASAFPTAPLSQPQPTAVSLSAFRVFVPPDREVHPLNVADAHQMFLLLLDYRPRLPLKVILLLVHTTFCSFHVFESAEDLSMALWLWCQGSPEERQNLVWKFGPSVNRWVFSKSIRCLSLDPGRICKLTLCDATVECFPRFFPHGFNEDINDWDVSNITDMHGLFAFATSFNRPLFKWNTSNVQSMSFMFFGADSFNQSLAEWDVSDVTAMTCMFMRANSFNTPLQSWAAQVSSVRVAKSMFCEAVSFNQPLVDFQWSSLISAHSMFRGATEFNGSVARWETPLLQDCTEMFCGAERFNQKFYGWNTPNLAFASRMFQNARLFNQSVLPWFQVSRVRHFQDMFLHATSFVIHCHFPFRELFRIEGKNAQYVFGPDHPFTTASTMYFDLADVLSMDMPDCPSDESLKCPICWNAYSCPTLMSCGCTFCYLCVAKYYSANVSALEDEDNDEEEEDDRLVNGIPTVSCPCCRQSKIQYACTDLTLSKIVDSGLQRKYRDQPDLLSLRKTQEKQCDDFMLAHEYSSYTAFYPVSKAKSFGEFYSTNVRTLFRVDIEMKKAVRERKLLEKNLALPSDKVFYIRQCLTTPFSAFASLRFFFTHEYQPTSPTWRDMEFFFQVLSYQIVGQLAREYQGPEEFVWWARQLHGLQFPVVANVWRAVNYLLLRTETTKKYLFLHLLVPLLLRPKISGATLPISEAPDQDDAFADNEGAGDFECPLCKQCLADAHLMKCCGNSACFSCIMKHMDQCRVRKPMIQDLFPCAMCGFECAFLDESFVCYNRRLDTFIEEQPDSIRGPRWERRKAQSVELRAFTNRCRVQFNRHCEPRTIVYVLQALNWFEKREKGPYQPKAGVAVEELVDYLSSLLSEEQKARLASLYLLVVAE